MTSASAQAPAKPRNSPLRAATLPAGGAVPGQGLTTDRRKARSGRGALTAADLRQMAISEFAAWLREQTNKLDRPFQGHTITNYTDAAKSLHRWMVIQKIDEDFTACDTAVLNRFFNDYRKGHTQGGTNTLQRNLAHLFVWLEQAYDHPNPYTARLNRYAPVKKRPATLSEEFIKDMIEVTGGGRARSYEDVRDHAIIRVFTESPSYRSHPDGGRRSVGRPDRPTLRQGGTTQGGTRLQRRPHRPAHPGDRPGNRRLPTRATLT
jgi:integrase/recombinase XerD